MPQLAAAVSTRYKKPELDYNWYVEVGDFSLFDKTKAIYRKLLRDRKGDAPRIIVIIDHTRIGLLIADMQSERQDYVGRLIYDTLYLEFDKNDRKAVLHAASAMLLMEFNEGTYEEAIQPLLQYAEDLSSHKDDTASLALQDVKLPQCSELEDNSTPFEDNAKEMALPSETSNRRKWARYMMDIAELEHLNFPFVFVSTGRVNLDLIKEYAVNVSGEQLIILTSSETVKEEVDLTDWKDLQKKSQHAVIDTAKLTVEKGSEIAEEFLERGRRWLKKKNNSLLKLVIAGAIILVGGFILLQDREEPQLTTVRLGQRVLAFNPTEQIQSLTLPRTAIKQSLILTFDEPLRKQSPPLLEIEEENVPVDFNMTACMLEEPTIWACQMAMTPQQNSDPNQKISFNLSIQDVQDKANNVMTAQLIPVQFESADIKVSSWHWHEEPISPLFSLPYQDIRIRIQAQIEARYGVSKVFINASKAILVSKNDDYSVWETVLYGLLKEKEVIISISDTNQNTMIFHQKLDLQ